MSLLKENYEKEFRKEKIIRLWIGLAVVLITAVSIGFVFMLPSYFSLVFSKEDMLRRLRASEEVFEQKEIKDLDKKVAAVNARISVFERNESRRGEFAPILNKIAENTPAGIKILSFDFKKEDNGSYILALDGAAPDRQGFLRYLDGLGRLKEFVSIDSPVTNLLRETDVLFTLKIKISPEIYKYVE